MSPLKSQYLDINGYTTTLGEMRLGDSLEFLKSQDGHALKDSVSTIVTSPPFPLISEKAYGNLEGKEYIDWLCSFAQPLREIMKPDGSLFIEIGNTWVSGEPAMSMIPLKALMAFAESGNYTICQHLIYHNPARPPGPASWVTAKRLRLKDDFTHWFWLGKSADVKADNSAVLKEYSPAMTRLLDKKLDTSGTRPSAHKINGKNFFKDNGGSIAGSVISIPNTGWDNYHRWCTNEEIAAHPARMPFDLARFFIDLTSTTGDLIFDPFGGSNTVGAAAEVLARRWMTVDLEPQYIAGSLGRFADESGTLPIDLNVSRANG